jgi:hypothetical protein
MMRSLGIRREEGETWKDAAARIGKKYGLETEVMESYASEIEAGESEEDAAWAACYEWDVCELVQAGAQ